MGTSSGACNLITSDLIYMHLNSYPYFIMRVKTWVPMFYFLNKLIKLYLHRINYVSSDTN